jgi:phage baseplate assembly protein W
MNVEFTTYPIQEWILDETSEQLGEPSLDVQSIAQDIKFILSTERNKYPIMGGNFGVELLDLIGKDSQYIQAQIKKRINEALSIDDRIIAVGSFKFENKEMGSLSVSFVVETVLGKVGMTTEVIS